MTKVFALLAPLDQARPFSDQVDQVVHIMEVLRLGGPNGSGLDPLRDALEDQAGVLERLGRGEAPWSWAAFVREVESIVLDLKVPGPPTRPGSVRMATVSEARGCAGSVRHPGRPGRGDVPGARRRRAVPVAAPGRAIPDEASRRIFSREMLRFLRVLGSAESGVVLIYPTTDTRGQDLLRAGFLDELMELLTPEAAAACHRSFGRVDPALVDSPEPGGLAGRPSRPGRRAGPHARRPRGPR